MRCCHHLVSLSCLSFEVQGKGRDGMAKEEGAFDRWRDAILHVVHVGALMPLLLPTDTQPVLQSIRGEHKMGTGRQQIIIILRMEIMVFVKHQYNLHNITGLASTCYW